MNLRQTAIALALAVATGPSLASELPQLDHAFVIVMENHQYTQIIGNPSAPFINSYAQSANLAANYYGIGHPSLTNYLEIIGGSNFGVRNDNSPDWHNTACTPNIVSGTPALEGAPAICPIAGKGTDGETPPFDINEAPPPGLPNLPFAYPAAPTVGRSIADQLDERELTWKSFQENLPPYGADGVNNSDGLISDSAGAKFSPLPKLYAVKHNPFAYFASVQQHGLRKIVDLPQLYNDLRSGHVPNFLFIVPNQCHDQHGRGASEVGAGCQYSDATGNPNQAVISQGDATLKNLVTAIKSSSVWTDGSNSAIVVVWDENDYSTLSNQVVTIVDTNYRVSPCVSSAVQYGHFSLLKTLEAGFGLGYLNHAADKTVPLMLDLFGR